MEPYPFELVLHKFVQDAIGTFNIIANYRPKNLRTGVWKLLSTVDNQFYYLKTFTRKERWHPEVYAYHNFICPLKSYVPQLIKVFEGEGLHAILITSIEGTIMRETNLDLQTVQNGFYKAGELTRLLHDSQTGVWFGRPDKEGNPMELYHHCDPVEYVYHSIEDTFKKCVSQNLLSPLEIKQVEWALNHVGVFEHTKPVPISWDSTPGNWIIGENNKFIGMIDFENMLWGIDVDNFSILFERYFADSPTAMKAFFEGYGLEVLKEKKVQIEICCIKMAIGDIYWGTQNNTHKVIDYGREFMKQIYNNKLLYFSHQSQ